MKRFYCDHCGNEMRYEDEPVHNTADKTATVLINTTPTLEVTITIDIKAQIVETAPDTIASHRERSQMGYRPPTTRRHADLCGPCRWGLIEQLRGGHNIRDDATFPPLEKPLNWKPNDD